MSINRNEERSLTGAAALVLVNSRHVIKGMVLINTSENAPQTLNTTPPVGTGLRSRFNGASIDLCIYLTCQYNIFKLPVRVTVPAVDV